ncbi:hypothetical protein [Bacteroides sp.]|uniref:hypothetical protein n=1 Tax=Bacteroides sp. TaxID=29523 RepID=UPI00260B1765|nr:hypothetical protein [Bacteroides sp.]MDD3040402.1 hypothetical protein [Bacteroides sp.]
MEEFLKRFMLSRGDFNYLKSLSLEQSKEIQKVINEVYNAHGEMLALKYIEDTRYLDEKMIDGINPGGIETAVYNDPYRLSVFIPEFPLHLKQYAKTKFSTKLGFDTAERWQNYMVVALRELRSKGAVMFIGPVVIFYLFHFPKQNMDVDNYAIKFINDTFRNGKIIEEDSYEHTSVFFKGIPDMVKRGTEINIVRDVDFVRFLTAIL